MHCLSNFIPLLTCLATTASAMSPVGKPRQHPAKMPSHHPGEAQKLADPNYGPIPGHSSLYSTYLGVERPFPGNITDPILPTEDGQPDPDDHVWQNLLSAEWIIFEFYQFGVEKFSQEDFVKAGFPATTLDCLKEIRNNEAGHLRIFQNQISNASVKPGACKYIFPFQDPTSYLAYLTVVEISSMAFLSGLVQDVVSDRSKGAMAAISQTEARHEVWALTELWRSGPFSGPSDTSFPYANQILYSTRGRIVPGSCPPENPEYPTPRQLLPGLGATPDTQSLSPGATITLTFPDPDGIVPEFDPDTQYYGVFFHGLRNISVPIDTEGFPDKPVMVTIPEEFEHTGIIVALVADEPGAPTKESVVAGPAVMLEQPAKVGVALLHGEAQESRQESLLRFSV
ncbi:hypothetical protein VTJ49DRAFT_7432 [Mycothermus thermophilus]|uniref:Stress response protein rds1p n=1 Tax=Humicola insolens TaxID=85995 RepID=A0ABR3VH78_HUMIN